MPQVTSLPRWALEHDPEKYMAVFRKDHAQSKAQSAISSRQSMIRKSVWRFSEKITLNQRPKVRFHRALGASRRQFSLILIS
jgi:hypothetical protein